MVCLQRKFLPELEANKLEREREREMGRVFLDHPGGMRIYSCASCDTPLTNRSELVSTVSVNFMMTVHVNINYVGCFNIILYIVKCTVTH